MHEPKVEQLMDKLRRLQQDGIFKLCRKLQFQSAESEQDSVSLQKGSQMKSQVLRIEEVSCWQPLAQLHRLQEELEEMEKHKQRATTAAETQGE
ncbi:hypothetical protein NQZ68_001850 [Dissostichus eleginoides]|nr:hypothetical protein NQZ68_001850 [Dissostichus eleginoides]